MLKHFRSTVPGKTSPRVKRILEVLFPKKRRRESSAFWKYCSRKKIAKRQTLQRWPNFTFFYFSGYSTSIFPGTVLPFCYFSVVRKVPEKPVLFLPHPRHAQTFYIPQNVNTKKLYCYNWFIPIQISSGETRVLMTLTHRASK